MESLFFSRHTYCLVLGAVATRYAPSVQLVNEDGWQFAIGTAWTAVTGMSIDWSLSVTHEMALVFLRRNDYLLVPVDRCRCDSRNICRCESLNRYWTSCPLYFRYTCPILFIAFSQVAGYSFLCLFPNLQFSIWYSHAYYVSYWLVVKYLPALSIKTHCMCNVGRPTYI